jgi:hypothetical protein
MAATKEQLEELSKTLARAMNHPDLLERTLEIRKIEDAYLKSWKEDEKKQGRDSGGVL